MNGQFFAAFIKEHSNTCFMQSRLKSGGRRLFLMDNDPSQTSKAARSALHEIKAARTPLNSSSLSRCQSNWKHLPPGKIKFTAWNCFSKYSVRVFWTVPDQSFISSRQCFSRNNTSHNSKYVKTNPGCAGLKGTQNKVLILVLYHFSVGYFHTVIYFNTEMLFVSFFHETCVRANPLCVSSILTWWRFCFSPNPRGLCVCNSIGEYVSQH